ncbi:hypothetical protein E1B06_09730 [Brevibacillus laterosporus]|nr:hypothetical protein D8Z77_10820 [Brevibacillus laterosporus]MDF9412000.1 hypothetical protein [Brevibacillus laterosporus]
MFSITLTLIRFQALKLIIYNISVHEKRKVYNEAKKNLFSVRKKECNLFFIFLRLVGQNSKKELGGMNWENENRPLNHGQ